MDDEQADRYRERYPELEIVQPAYSIIESDESAPDDANISNPDNETGYKYGNTYVMNAHVAAILKKRHRVLAKVTKKPTSRKVEMAGQTVDVNNPDGEMTYCPLDDTSSNKYYDGSAAKLDSSCLLYTSPSPRD